MRVIVRSFLGFLCCLTMMACGESNVDPVAGQGVANINCANVDFFIQQRNGACANAPIPVGLITNNIGTNISGTNCSDPNTAALNPTICGSQANNCFNVSQCQGNQVLIPNNPIDGCGTGRTGAFDINSGRIVYLPSSNQTASSTGFSIQYRKIESDLFGDDEAVSVDVFHDRVRGDSNTSIGSHCGQSVNQATCSPGAVGNNQCSSLLRSPAVCVPTGNNSSFGTCQFLTN